ncbi:penicillin-binding protein 1A [Vibrio ulleungensis]|uniref:Penicillin-binding protein 1A n=1 Tax=Vibrio ulleungensis TaxID=2807619 RepID=A0ABS2HNL3_9VIBR|nr:PBP1A family penicillin-binding protein [Vibrio ulleungensis]MBM7037793.1 PBP1A family penicillin-binding protein [Vibrio ulleungensis]
MKFIKITALLALFCIVLGIGTTVGLYFYLKPQFPDVAVLKDVQLQTPMQVYSKEGKLIAQFGEKRRIPLKLDQMPQELIDAVIATEDSRFYDHFGFDPIGMTRAAIVVATSGSLKEGASTITQQLARNFFLTNDKRIMRKIKEIFIAVHIEQLLTKEEILELYLNKIYLGHRSYGVGAAAQVYFGRELTDLSLGELALIAGLPKAPSTMNPIYSTDRATTRRNVVLARMLSENKISQAEHDAAREEEFNGKSYGAEIEVRAPYVAEIARAWMVDKYGEESAYTSGMRVFTTIDAKQQAAATDAAINNLMAYDLRHGYRGAERELWKSDQPSFSEAEIVKALRTQPSYGQLRPAAIVEVQEKALRVFVKGQGTHTLEWDDIKWARRFLTDTRQGPAPKVAADIAAAGEQIWVYPKQTEQQLVEIEEGVFEEQQVVTAWKLSQVPAANTAFVAMNPENGQILSLVGGFNFVHNKFNRATQSVRQVGSSIKPFIYSAALDSGLTLASLINDTPINQWDQSAGTAWRPKNSPPTYLGPTRLRIGLAQSKNVMAVRTLRHVGLDETRDYLTRFGFELDKLPRSETIALGAGSLTPLQMAQGYSVFANGGYYVEPYIIDRVETPFGDIEFQAAPVEICRKDCTPLVTESEGGEEFNEQDVHEFVGHEETVYAPQVITEQTAFLVREMLYSNVWGGGNWAKNTGWNGTGFRAQALKRRDVGGKTGTTNSSKDAWYSGYGPGVVAVSWVGFDAHNRDLGRTAVNKNFAANEQVSGGEAGAKTAQPAWIDYMKVALADVPAQRSKVPNDIVRARIDRETGLLTHKTDETSRMEYFLRGTEPTESISKDRDTFSDDLFIGGDDDEETEDDGSLF